MAAILVDMVIVSSLLGALFVVSGIGHVVAPTYVASLVPRWVPRPALVVGLTGILDVAAGVALLVPDVRHLGGVGASVLLTGYIGVHLDAVPRRSDGGPLMLRPAVVVLRVVLNLVYLGAAVAVALGGPPG